MSTMMARQGGVVQLEQSDMRLALNIAKMAKVGFRINRGNPISDQETSRRGPKREEAGC